MRDGLAVAAPVRSAASLDLAAVAPAPAIYIDGDLLLASLALAAVLAGATLALAAIALLAGISHNSVIGSRPR